MTNAPFRFADHALRFAFDVQQQPIMNAAQTMAAVRRGSRSSRLAGLSPHDLHAQGAMIRARVMTFPRMERGYLLAAFGYGDERRAGMEVVVPWVIAQQPTGAYERRAFEVITDQYMGKFIPLGIAHVRRALRCRKETALEIRERAWRALDGLHARALAVADEVFTGLGVVEPEAER